MLLDEVVSYKNSIYLKKLKSARSLFYFNIRAFVAELFKACFLSHECTNNFLKSY